MSCPICHAKTSREYRPFCSRRCANVDLGRWLTGGYAIQAEEAPSDDETEPRIPSDPRLH